MRVLQLGKFYPIKGGVEKVMWDLTIGLAGQGVKSEMLCACLGPDLEAVNTATPRPVNATKPRSGEVVLQPVPGAKVHLCKALFFKASTMIAPAMISRLRQLIRAAEQEGEPYDLIHIHHPDPMACLALRLSSYEGKVVLHYHSDILGKKAFYLMYRPLERWLVNRADLILGTTPVYVRESKVLKDAQSKIRVVPIGAEDFSLRPGGQRKQHSAQEGSAPRTAAGCCELNASRTDADHGEHSQLAADGSSELNLRAAASEGSAPRTAAGCEEHNQIDAKTADNKKLVFSMGRLVPYKGYTYLIEAAKYLPDDYFIVIGGSGPLREELQNQIVRGGLEDKVTLAGRIPDEELARWYSSCDVFCMSSIMRTEAFGIVQIEAMSCSAPVVATEIPGSGVSWVNAHGQSGLNVPHSDAAALADAIQRICVDENTHNAFCNGARARYEEFFRPERMILSCLDIYNEIITIQ